MMGSLENAFSGLKPNEADASKKSKFEGGKSLSEKVTTPWLEKRPMEEEIDALKKLSKSYSLILGNLD